MKAPLIDAQMLEFVTARFDNPAKSKDSADSLRWKAAQREVVIQFKELHEAQRELKSSSNLTVENHSNIDPRIKD